MGTLGEGLPRDGEKLSLGNRVCWIYDVDNVAVMDVE